jgi:hypothetical protein
MQPIDSSGGRNGGFDVGATSDFRTLAVEQLAKHLAAAYLAYAMDLNFPEAMRYVQRQPRAGDLWTVAARFIFGAKSLIDRVHGR